MKKEITIIPVDETHRIQITKVWNGDRNKWGWKVEKQKFFRFFSFWKNWHRADWTENGGYLLMTVQTFFSKYDALQNAEYIKNNYLKS